MQVLPQLRGPQGANDAAALVAQPVTSGPGVCTHEVSEAVALFDAAKVFRSAGYLAAARRIESRARRTPLPKRSA